MSFNLEQIGSRLQVARHVLGKQRPEMAALLNVSAVTYGNYERGNQNLLGRLADLATTHCVSQEFLLRGPLTLVPAADLSYRKLVSLKSPEARHIQGMASLASEFRLLVEEFVSLPPVSLPTGHVTDKLDVEDVVREMRAQLRMSDAPLKSAMGLAESLGVLVFWVQSDKAFNGVSFWKDGHPYVLLNSNHSDGYRARFTLLHELGHLICHKNNRNVEAHEVERGRYDREANYFASCFLMPASSFAKRFPKHGGLLEILDDRHYWMASCAAMVRRAFDLNLIDEDRYRKLSVGISVKGWRKSEPNTPTPEQSRVHQFFLDEAGDQGLRTADLADRIACPLGWFREAFPQSEQYQMTFNLDAFR